MRVQKPNGQFWDFGKAVDRREAEEYVREHKPTWLIGSPPCTAFSILNFGMNYPKMDPEVVRAKIKEGRMHLRFMLHLYKIQLDGGRHFLHEHPATARSWQDDQMVKMLRHPRVGTTVSDQCEYG